MCNNNYNWRETSLSPYDTMEMAIMVLDKEAPKIVLIVDENDTLLGTITDGDIRRALISHKEMNVLLVDIMCDKPIYSNISDSDSGIIDKMKKHSVFHMPVLNSKQKVVGLKVFKDLADRPLKENPVFIMAGGYGMRLKPLTDDLPKPLLKIVDKPILLIIIQQFIKHGFYKFYISVHYKSEMIKEYFGGGSDLGIDITYIHEDDPLGTAGAIGYLPKKIELPIILTNGDLLTKINYNNLIDFHNSYGGSATMCVRKYNVDIPYGVVDCSQEKIIKITEKPTQNFFINAGVYVLEPDVIKKINKSSYMDMPDFIQYLISNNNQINMFPVYEYWLDIGQINQYEQAQKDYLELGL